MYLSVGSYFHGGAMAALFLAFGMIALGACVQADLAAAMRHCRPCKAMPPPRNFVLVDRVDATRCQKNMTVRVRLNEIDAIDNRGRFAHVRGFWLKAVGHFAIDTGGGQTPSSAVSAYDLRSLWGDMRLKDTVGHSYFDALDGRDLLDDTFFRHWAEQTVNYLHYGVQGSTQPQITADNGLQSFNADQADVSVDLDLYYPLVTYGGSPFEGLIPLAMLQRGGFDSFTFRIQPSLTNQSPPGGGAPIPPVGVTFDHLSRSNGDNGMDVWADIVYLPAYVIDAPWNLDSYTLQEMSGALKNEDRTTEYAHIRFHTDDNADSRAGLYGQALAQSTDQTTITIAGEAVVAGYDKRDMASRGSMFYALEKDGAHARNNATQDLPMFAGGGLNFGDPDQALAVVLLPVRQRETAPAGAVHYKFSERDGDFTRFLHRTVECHSVARAQRIALRLKCSPCLSICPVMGKNGTPVSDVLSTSPVLVVPSGSGSFAANPAQGPI